MPITVQGRLSHHLDRGPAAPAPAGMSWLPHLPRPVLPSTLPSGTPYQSTRPFFQSLIDPFARALARFSQSLTHTLNQSINQSIIKSPIVCHAMLCHAMLCYAMPRLGHSLIPVNLPPVVPVPSPSHAHPSVPCRTSELTD